MFSFIKVFNSWILDDDGSWVQTDKAVVSMEADDEGILAKILVKEGVDGVKVQNTYSIINNIALLTTYT